VKKARNGLLLTTLAALGVVYGDIGTSPLYAIRECFRGPEAIGFSPERVLGVLSLIFWSLLVVISVKYLVFVMRADNHGEGGILALMVQAVPFPKTRRGKLFVTVLGLFGAGLLYGDGMITPAISVLSAIEGLGLVAPSLKTWVIPLTLGILFLLFFVQHHGTARMGRIFGPVMLLWFTVLALLGAVSIAAEPGVLRALNPGHAFGFLFGNGKEGFLILGVVFLVVTGGEALYADMGHFGAAPIRRAWFGLVLPALLLNYFGQGALLLRDSATAESPFYLLAPEWARYPLVALATVATIIASQAVISGAFSLAHQAIQLGFSPRLQVVHTSHDERGQIYVPAVNWLLFLAVVGLVLAFRSSSNLAGAYGMAVTSTMVITTGLLYLVARKTWGWSRTAAGILMSAFLVVDLAFFSANLIKVMAGGWFPLLVGACICVLFTTWTRGRQLLANKFRSSALATDVFVKDQEKNPALRVPGAAVFLTSNPEAVPPALLHNLEHNRILHEKVGLLTIVIEDRPRVRADKRVEVVDLGLGLYRITARFGYMDNPNVVRILNQCEKHGVEFDPETTTFFLGSEVLGVGGRGKMARWRKNLFAWMSRNARNASVHFGVPSNRVIEIGIKVEL